jgi:hypothetical protein
MPTPYSLPPLLFRCGCMPAHKIKTMSKYSNGLRSANSSSDDVARVDFQELIDDIKAEDVRFAHPKNGKHEEYMHLVSADGSYYSIGLGEKLENVPTDEMKKAKWLINNAVVFTGEKEVLKNGVASTVRWFTFGPEPEFPESKLISLASLMGKGKNVTANA